MYERDEDQMFGELLDKDEELIILLNYNFSNY